MSELEKLLTFIPEKYRPLASLLICASPLITRAVYALMNNGGIRGVISSIWLGTNTPKSKPEAVDIPVKVASDSYDPKNP